MTQACLPWHDAAKFAGERMAAEGWGMGVSRKVARARAYARGNHELSTLPLTFWLKHCPHIRIDVMRSTSLGSYRL